ncbi:MAG: DUF4158 domain-containing protein [Actinomycetota bacterium]|nr:DUF4158 domain-containing protein [Actinomycetota bacterium]
MTTVRSLSLFLADPLDVPNAVLEYLADQSTSWTRRA